MRSKYLPSSEMCQKKITMSIWDALMQMNDFVDQSDPDTTLPNIEHAFQTAEGIRKANLPDWMQLAGLIHDLGKILFIKGCIADGTDITTQHGVVGDTYPVAYKKCGEFIPILHSKELIFPEFNAGCQCECQAQLLNNHMDSTNDGEDIGFSNCLFTFGHDEYLWNVLTYNSRRKQCRMKLSLDLHWHFLYFIRFHSFYAWHHEGAYSEFADIEDRMALKDLQQFSSFDLYTKCDQKINSHKDLKPYYNSLAVKYLGCSLDDPIEW
jgi:inositol oxygenase